MHYETRVNEVIGGYEIDPLPGNGDVAVSHGVYLREGFRGAGLGQRQHEERLANITNQNYMAVICTVREDNEVEKHILTKNGWTKVWGFPNKDGEKVELWARAT